MESNIFIPKKLRVGYNKRSDTYTGKLAYVIYYDEKNKIRKEFSFENWRNKTIEPDEFENVPTNGFVLNKNVGGYFSGWDSRKAYIRIYDPRGFEFEIDVVNLLYILENTNSIKGKGLEGEFIYGWSGKDLILIPCDSSDYQKLLWYNEARQSKDKVCAKDLKIGATYLNRRNKQVVYVGSFDYYNCNTCGCQPLENQGKSYWFYEINNTNNNYNDNFISKKSLSNYIVRCLDEKCVDNYSDIFSKLENNPRYSPFDRNRDKLSECTMDEFIQHVKEEMYRYTLCQNEMLFRGIVNGYQEIIRLINEKNSDKINLDEDIFNVSIRDKLYPVAYRYAYTDLFQGNINEIFQKCNPMYLCIYLTNGNLYKKEFLI